MNKGYLAKCSAQNQAGKFHNLKPDWLLFPLTESPYEDQGNSATGVFRKN